MQRNMVNHSELSDGYHKAAMPTDNADLSKDVANDKTVRSQIEQRLHDTQKQRELFQAKATSIQNIEKKYDDLILKHRAVLAQLNQMATMIDHYKVLVSQLEKEKMLILAENKSLKAQENIAHDKAMLYNLLMERSKKLEEENSSLVLENETQQKMYERCIDEISRQVVEALLMQKGLQEQCRKLQERVKTVESLNSEFNQMVVQQRGTGSGYPAPHPTTALAAIFSHMSSSDTRLQQLLPSVGAVRKAKLRNQTASPSADSVQSMPVQAVRWSASTCGVEDGSTGSLDFDHFVNSEHFAGRGGGRPEMSSPPLWIAAASIRGSHEDNDVGDGLGFVSSGAAPRSASVDSHLTSICIETEFPATNTSPKIRRLERHPSSSGSLDLAYCSGRGFVKYDGSDVRHMRSASAEALRDARLRPADIGGSCNSAAATPRLRAKVQKPLHYPATTISDATSRLAPAYGHVRTDEGVAGSVEGGADKSAASRTAGHVVDVFSEDADDILAKHKSLVVAGSMEDIFSHCITAALRDRGGSNETWSGDPANRSGLQLPLCAPPLPPPRSRSRCSSVCSASSDGGDEITEDEVGDSGAPPLPPRSASRLSASSGRRRRPYKPLPQEPSVDCRIIDGDDGGALSSSTDTDSIKQEINVLTSRLAELARSV